MALKKRAMAITIGIVAVLLTVVGVVVAATNSNSKTRERILWLSTATRLRRPICW
jgi:glucose uptake protein GlcU